MPFIENNDIRALIGSFVLVSCIIGSFSCILWCLIKREENKKYRRVSPIIVNSSYNPNIVVNESML